MKKSLLTLLALVVLISQGLWVDHLYHDHDQDEVCEVCLVAHSQDHFVAPSLLSLSINRVFSDRQAGSPEELIALAANFCRIRAPPATS
ncbi:MAG: hypothetical protein KZQ73_00570 [Candidatus Thiodiazotropha sp. (ex Semelilucina semeliformis)]|nr:hypothetical protein [Candidatus Thiodiazotropha sp. (ex Semelilucina semeliformis)]